MIDPPDRAIVEWSGRPMRVLYATDGGAAAMNAGHLIDVLASRGVEVVVASIVSTGSPELRHLSATFQSDDARRRTAQDAVDRAVESLRASGFPAVDGIVDQGRPAPALLDIATARGADLIVAGTGVQWLGGRLLGSVSTALLHAAPMSVLIAHDAPRGAAGHVVAGTDGSEHAARAIDVATGFLDPDRCAVTVVSAAKLMASTFTPPYTGYATSAPSPQVEAEVLAPARAHAERAAERLADAGFAADIRVMLGHPVKRLLSEMDNLGAALAVVGSRGLGAMERVALGSVSDEVVRHAPAALVGR
jgi:nucleotide-binding universal stress UspA family protein